MTIFPPKGALVPAPVMVQARGLLGKGEKAHMTTHEGKMTWRAVARSP